MKGELILYDIREASRFDWELELGKSNNINMLQSWQYGDAKENSSKWKAIRFLVTKDGEVVGLVQLLTLTLPFLGGVARLNRGPIIKNIVDEKSSEHEKLEILRILLKEAKKRRWWVMFVAPEIKYSKHAQNELNNIGFMDHTSIAYGSGKLNLEIDESKLLMNLKKKWRYYLRKGMDANIDFAFVDKLDLNDIIKRYENLQQKNNFLGFTNNLINELVDQKDDNWEFVAFTAKKSSSGGLEDLLGLVVIIKHYDTSTYLIGITNEEGRKLCVNYALLWKAIIFTKDNNCQWFDIGGLDESTPEGIAHFKRGLNSNLYSLVGEWRYYLIPWIPSVLKNSL